jgi:hypothetical protein
MLTIAMSGIDETNAPRAADDLPRGPGAGAATRGHGPFAELS